MAVNAIEAGVGDVVQTKQAALGTIEPVATTANSKHLRKVGDEALKAAVTHGSEEWVDGKQFGSPSMFVDTVGGDVGKVTAQAQPGIAGFCFAQIIGVDVVTGTTPNFTHTIATGTANGPLQTFRQKTGVSVGPWRNAFWDAKINTLAFNASKDDEVAKIEQGVMALKAGTWTTADPAAADSGVDPYKWSEGVGAHTIDGVVLSEIEGETLEIDRKLDVHRGDSQAPVAYVPGKGEIITSLSAIVTDNTILRMKQVLYGTTTPTDAQEISATINYVAMESLYTRDANNSLKITRPKVEVDPSDFEVSPRAEGGKIPVTFGGRCLNSGATPMLTVVDKVSDAAASASYV
jgi:hypothetical protein